MLSFAVRSLFGRTPSQQAAKTVAAIVRDVAGIRIGGSQDQPPEPRTRSAWPPPRLALANQLWGPGFIFPGGEIETLRMTRPLGISAAASLLLVGVGGGGAAGAVTRNFGAWVAGVDTDPALIAAARTFIAKAQLSKKVSIKSWDPDHPDFGAKSHHHCLALEPLHGARAEPILTALARAVRPGGQLVITELTADAPLNPTDPVVSRWAALEKRDPAHLLAPVAVTRMLGRIGLDVRVAEDISQRHLEHAMVGWRVMLRALRERKPTRQEAVQLVSEAELWLLRRRLVHEGRLRMTRWHAISHAPIV